MRLNRESGWKCKLPEWGMQPHRIRADKPGRADYPLLMRQCLRTHFDDLSATRSDETGALRLWFDADVVVHGSANPLLAAEMALSCLHGNVAKKKLDLIQFSTRCMAQLRARTPQIMRRHLRKSEYPRVLFHDMPDYSFGYAVTPVFACPTDTSEQSSDRYSGCSHPKINGPFDPFGNRHGSNVAPFADQINYDPMFLALL